MHLAEGTLPLWAAGIGWAIAAPWVWWSARAPAPDDPRATGLRGAAGGLLFAVTLVPLPVPVLGVTSHLCLSPALALALGPRAVVAPVAVVLFLQAIFFAHGGLSTLGVNTLTLGLIGPMVALGAARLGRAAGAPVGLWVGLACAAGDLSVYVADAAALALTLPTAAGAWATFGALLAGFAPVQVPLAALEGVVSALMLRALAARRPGLLPPPLQRWGGHAPLPPAAALVLLLTLLGGCATTGLDDHVFGAAAAAAGRPPTGSLLDLSAGELGLAASVLIPFGAGFVLGRGVERLRRSPPDDPHG